MNKKFHAVIWNPFFAVENKIRKPFRFASVLHHSYLVLLSLSISQFGIYKIRYYLFSRLDLIKCDQTWKVCISVFSCPSYFLILVLISDYSFRSSACFIHSCSFCPSESRRLQIG